MTRSILSKEYRDRIEKAFRESKVASGRELREKFRKSTEEFKKSEDYKMWLEVARRLADK